ncbi:hypothetical protein ABFT80_20355 [Mesorhizobium sp. SB112]|uniref:hypothetical protein n=1 Tax=Mesorhizobium sp. SB112 TaxID=3151853 RepID=UPI003263218B
MSSMKRLAGLIITAALLYAMQITTPLYSEITAPVPIPGKRGTKVDTSSFTIGIAKVHLTRSIVTTSFGRNHTHTTSGVWVIVEGAAVAKFESLSLTSAQWLGHNGIRYALSQRLHTIPGMLGTERLEPGIPRPVLMAFEIPESQLIDGKLLIARSALTPLGDEARIEMTDIQADDIRPAIALGRGNRVLPWVLEAE